MRVSTDGVMPRLHPTFQLPEIDLPAALARMWQLGQMEIVENPDARKPSSDGPYRHSE